MISLKTFMRILYPNETVDRLCTTDVSSLPCSFSAFSFSFSFFLFKAKIKKKKRKIHHCPFSVFVYKWNLPSKERLSKHIQPHFYLISYLKIKNQLPNLLPLQFKSSFSILGVQEVQKVYLIIHGNQNLNNLGNPFGICVISLSAFLFTKNG